MTTRNAPPAPLAVTVPDAARMLSCSPQFVWKLLNEGRLTRVKLGSATRVRVADLVAFLDAGGTDDNLGYPEDARQSIDPGELVPA